MLAGQEWPAYRPSERRRAFKATDATRVLRDESRPPFTCFFPISGPRRLLSGLFRLGAGTDLLIVPHVAADTCLAIPWMSAISVCRVAAVLAGCGGASSLGKRSRIPRPGKVTAFPGLEAHQKLGPGASITFQSCSSFTRVTACEDAQSLWWASSRDCALTSFSTRTLATCQDQRTSIAVLSRGSSKPLRHTVTKTKATAPIPKAQMRRPSAAPCFWPSGRIAMSQAQTESSRGTSVSNAGGVQFSAPAAPDLSPAARFRLMSAIIVSFSGAG